MPDFNRTELSALPVSIAINTLLEASSHEVGEPTRGYLGASSIGSECLRQVQFDWMCNQQHPLQTRDRFSRGHFLERLSREHFTRAKFVFADQDRLAFEALDGMLKGHADGIFVVGPNIPEVAYPCLWEHKGLNGKGFKSIERDGLRKAYPQYAVQICLYQHFLGVDANAAIFTAMNADSCERLHVLVPYDAAFAKTWIERAEIVIQATRAGELLPRFTDNPDHYRCRFCGHRARCWRRHEEGKTS
jgi:hypothetical protein